MWSIAIQYVIAIVYISPIVNPYSCTCTHSSVLIFLWLTLFLQYSVIFLHLLDGFATCHYLIRTLENTLKNSLVTRIATDSSHHTKSILNIEHAFQSKLTIPLLWSSRVDSSTVYSYKSSYSSLLAFFFSTLSSSSAGWLRFSFALSSLLLLSLSESLSRSLLLSLSRCFRSLSLLFSRSLSLSFYTIRSKKQTVYLTFNIDGHDFRSGLRNLALYLPSP